jgi:hypothetical protein
VDILDLALYQVEQMFHEKVQQTLNSIKWKFIICNSKGLMSCFHFL